MELGEKLKAARLEAGLSQRQLCGDIITRNMLSQIENGTAKPSYHTLQALCTRLGKPLRYFWEDGPSENLSLLHQATQATAKEALELLKAYIAPDPMLDAWYAYLSGKCYLTLAREAASQGRKEDGRFCLTQATKYGNQSKEFSMAYETEITLLWYDLEPQNIAAIAETLPDNTRQQLLRAKAALEQGNRQQCLHHLHAADQQTEEILLLTADVLIQEKSYTQAIDTLLKMEHIPGTYNRLELCYRELGNFERAYYYACKQRTN